MSLRLFLLFAFSILSVLNGKEARLAEQESEEVTIAESLDLSAWLSNEDVVNRKIFGSWKLSKGAMISIHPLPLAANTCLVQLENRMVPGFWRNVDGENYLVLGTHASVHLKLMPRVFRCREINEDLLEICEVAMNTRDRSGIIDSPEMLLSLLKESCVESDCELRKLEWVRI